MTLIIGVCNEEERIRRTFGAAVAAILGTLVRRRRDAPAAATIATTITMTITFGSLKLWLATTSAAAMLRWPVASAMTRFVSALGPPSNQPTRWRASTEMTQAQWITTRTQKCRRKLSL